MDSCEALELRHYVVHAEGKGTLTDKRPASARAERIAVIASSASRSRTFACS